ncbi:oligosaccharide flippase family protein, partial [bacterium]|nr:oligosaccharide flippase family protein [bacterium]
MQKLKSFFSSEFSKNVLTLMTGTTISQAIPLAATPILTRIYTPEDFGVLALFSSITAILGLLATGKYEMAILLPKDDKDALNIVYLSVILSAIFSIILFTIVFLFNYEI